MLKRSTLWMVVANLFCAGQALGASYTSEFTGANNLDNWDGGGETVSFVASGGAVDVSGDTGYVKVDDSGGAPAQISTYDAQTHNTNFLGDLTRYQDLNNGEFKVTYWYRDGDGTDGPAFAGHMGDWLRIWSAGVVTGWDYPFPNDFAADWKKRVVPFDTDWSDTDAMNAGWIRIAGTDSFQDSVADVNWMLLYGEGAAGGGANTGHYDHVTIMPEPATLGMLVIGGAMLLKRQKRSV